MASLDETGSTLRSLRSVFYIASYQIALHGYMTVSEVGLMAIGSSRSDCPLSISSPNTMATSADLRPSDPSDLWGESLQVVLLLL